jgi:hypothetical protein
MPRRYRRLKTVIGSLGLVLAIFPVVHCNQGIPSAPVQAGMGNARSSSADTTMVYIGSSPVLSGHSVSGSIHKASDDYYHTENCRNLPEPKIEISLSEACKKSYSPCPVCQPPACPTSTGR